MCVLLAAAHVHTRQTGSGLAKHSSVFKTCGTTLPIAIFFICRLTVEIDASSVEVGDQLGSGGFSVVYRGSWLGTAVAIKKWFDSNATAEQRLEIREEIMLLSVRVSVVSLCLCRTIKNCTLTTVFAARDFAAVLHAMRQIQCGASALPLPLWVQALRHPHIVLFCGASFAASSTLMVSELMSFSLYDVLYNLPKVSLQLPQCLRIALDICRAFRYLHSRKPQVIHRCARGASQAVLNAKCCRGNKGCAFARSPNHSPSAPPLQGPQAAEHSARPRVARQNL